MLQWGMVLYYWWQFGAVVMALGASTKLLYDSTGMSDHLWAGKLTQYVTSHPDQLSSCPQWDGK